MPDQITSTSNEKIKRLIRLRERKERERSGLTIIDGGREIQRAIDAGIDILEIYHCGKLTKLSTRLKSEHNGLFIETNQKVFQRIAYGERQGGAVAIARIIPKSFDDLKAIKPALFLVLEGIEKPGNLGAILRTCDSAGVDGVILTEVASDLTNPNTIRSSLGALFTVNVVASNNKATLEFLKKQKVQVLATSPDAHKKYSQIDLKVPLALVMGSEDKGLSSFWIKAADDQISIPMKGTIDSLNVSASASIILYEIIRQRSS